MTRRVMSLDEGGAEVLIAEFKLVEGVVEGTYPGDRFGWIRSMFEEDGIVVYDRVLRVEDGEAFLDNLEVGLANSSRWFVREGAS